MSAETTPKNNYLTDVTRIGTADRLSFTFTVSTLLVAALIFGLSFFSEPREKPENLPTLDVILVQKKSIQAPKKADFLAQSNQQGGGHSQEKARPTNLIAGPTPEYTGLAPVRMRKTVPSPTVQKQDNLISNLNARTQVLAHQKPDEERKPTSPPRPAELENLDIAKLENEIADRIKKYAHKPKKKYISASTKEDIYARYLHAWAARVKRMGNLNYPAEARRRHLTGELILSVGLRRDGSVAETTIIKSSGHKVLDDAAKHIVAISSPFEPLPEDSTADILYITRTWQFLPGQRIRTK